MKDSFRSPGSAALSFVLGVSVFAGVLVGACGSDPAAGGGDAAEDDAGVVPPVGSDAAASCATGLVACGGGCVVTQTDPKHCGGCDQACATNEACWAGACVAVCQLDGKPVLAGAPNPTNACEQCSPAMSPTAWSPVADGAACGVGQVCEAGACGAAKCFIGGKVHAAGAANPENGCEQCVPATSTSAWTARSTFPLLVGGTDVATQGWTTAADGPNTLTYGADHVRLATSTTGGAQTGGRLLLARPNAVEPAKAFKLRFSILVESVNDHNSLDTGAGILGAATAQLNQLSGARAQMIYLDNAAIGWADDSQSAAFAITDGTYHLYELAVDAANVATVSVDGTPKLTRSAFTFAADGTIAVGDQTNDPNVDGVIRIKSIERVCP